MLVVGELSLDLDNYEVRVRGEKIDDLTLRELKILKYLAMNKGKIVTKEELLEVVYESNDFGNISIVDVTIMRIIEKIEEDVTNPQIIKVKKGKGYYVGELNTDESNINNQANELEISVDLDNCEVRVGNKRIDLTLRQCEVLKYLVMQTGKIVTKEELLEKVWNSCDFRNVSIVHTTIMRIIEEIEEDVTNPKIIKVKRGKGYYVGELNTGELNINNQANELEVGELSLDLNNCEVRVGNKKIDLTSKEFKVLKYLMSKPREATTNEELLANVLKYSDIPTVANTVRSIRNKIELNPSNPKIILTERGLFGIKYYLGKKERENTSINDLSNEYKQLKSKNNVSNILIAGELSLDLDNYEVKVGCKKIDLTLREFMVLEYLMSNYGKAISNEELLANIWKYEQYSDSRTVAMTIRNIREKIEIDPSNPPIILTKRGPDEARYYIGNLIE